MSYKMTVDITPLEPYYPGVVYHFFALICVFFCFPVALYLWYLGTSVNSEYDKLSDDEKRAYQKKNR